MPIPAQTRSLKSALHRPCRTPDALHAWIRLFTGLQIPRHNVCPHHDSPFEYIQSAYFEPAADLIVHAPRGGGKTRLAALATLLDLLHKPGCTVRILGGSLEQSMRMWEHLLPDLRRLAPDGIVTGGSSRRVNLSEGASAAVLAQSQRAVRGIRVQKLRCDEVEMFDPEVWSAAQLVTRSIPGAAGVVEALSTHHRPFGLMAGLLESARKSGSPRIIRWCVLDVLQRCPPERPCDGCPLWDDCAGIAKTRCDGFVSIDDAINLKKRVSSETWSAEMLCRNPSTSSSVFPSFDPAVHVVRDTPTTGEPSTDPESGEEAICLAMDFGFAAPFVCLWIRVQGETLLVLDEYVQPQRTLAEHLMQIQAKGYGTIRWVACDPAGNARDQLTAGSPVTELRRAGYAVRSRSSRITDGLELIRLALRPASGEPTLFVHARCTRLIRAMQAYRYADGGSELPVKDGTHDHLVDALRYFFVNRTRGRIKVSEY